MFTTDCRIIWRSFIYNFFICPHCSVNNSTTVLTIILIRVQVCSGLQQGHLYAARRQYGLGGQRFPCVPGTLRGCHGGRPGVPWEGSQEGWWQIQEAKWSQCQEKEQKEDWEQEARLGGEHRQPPQTGAMNEQCRESRVHFLLVWNTPSPVASQCVVKSREAA